MYTRAALHVLWYKFVIEWKKITGQSFIEVNTTIIKSQSTKHALSAWLIVHYLAYCDTLIGDFAKGRADT